MSKITFKAAKKDSLVIQWDDVVAGEFYVATGDTSTLLIFTEDGMYDVSTGYNFNEANPTFYAADVEVVVNDIKM